jgi:hypothetical protein
VVAFLEDGQMDNFVQPKSGYPENIR